ncbi:MAG: Neopullulanase 2 [Bacteroidota bacterium]|jgi:glycosidase
MKRIALLVFIGFALTANAQTKKSVTKPQQKVIAVEKKKVVYQVFTRLFGNKNTTNKPWGTIAENGVGKFNDFTDKALTEIKNLGVTHIWYTGVPHHALVNDYIKYGISNDDPEVVKGRAGSPYAVKDYYSVNPDLAVDPSKRMEEFEALIARSHRNGLKVIIDIVPNHIARKYVGLNNPNGVRDFGADDNTKVEYDRNNNFYYIPGQPFQVPTSDSYKPLNGEAHPLIDGKFDENPAKWTGNGSRLAKPDINDWYETVKVNYGVRPDGTKDFPELPNGFDKKSYKEYFEFWKNKDVPSSWKKFRDIALFWNAKGVDGFRYDMAEMVPYEFWSYMNSAIKMKNPDAFLMAEVYNPNEYRNYIYLGKMDYLYDKVATYDKLKEVVQGKSSADGLTNIQNSMADIESHMLHFLDNHDEQRVASPEFAGSGECGKPLMVVSATIGSAPTMLYFGQEVGEAGNENGGFGTHSRTSIFDYVGVPNHQKWMNGGKFDGGLLSDKEKELRDFYKRLLNFTLKSDGLMGQFEEIQTINRKETLNYDESKYAFVRWSAKEKLIIAVNFSKDKEADINLIIPAAIIAKWKLKDGVYKVTDQLYGGVNQLQVVKGIGTIKVNLPSSGSYIYKL